MANCDIDHIGYRIPARWHRSRSACPSPNRLQPTAPAPTQILADAPPHRLAAVSARSWCGPVLLRSAESHEFPNRQRVPRPPSDTPFAIYTFEVPYQQQPKIDSGSQPWPPHHGCLETPALAFHESVKIVFRQQLVQALVKGMAGRPRQTAGWNPKLLLMLPARAPPYGDFTIKHSRHKLFSDFTASGTCGRLWNEHVAKNQ